MQRWTSFTFALTLSLLVAGCLGGAPPPAPSPEADRVTIDEARPEPSSNDIPAADLGYVAQPDLNATLAAPPRLVEGEWWRVRMHDPILDWDAEFVRVMAEDTGEGYVFGMPHEGWFKEAVIFHLPALGDVDRDLSSHAHGDPFTPLVFPLELGKTWRTDYAGTRNLKAEVVEVDETAQTARVTFVIDGGEQLTPGIDLTYDAKAHEIVKMRVGNTHIEVVEHGYGFEGWVTVPRADAPVFLTGRFAGGLHVVRPEPAPPTEEVVVSGGYNRVSFAITVSGGGIFALPGGPALPDTPGMYRVRAVAPDGTEFLVESQGETKTVFLEHPDPDGTWSFEFLAGGAGVAGVEGVAYHQYDIQLPGGAIRSDHAHGVIR